MRKMSNSDDSNTLRFGRMNVREVARELRMQPKLVRKLIRAGELRASRVTPRHTLVTVASVQALLRRTEVE